MIVVGNNLRKDQKISSTSLSYKLLTNKRVLFTFGLFNFYLLLRELIEQFNICPINQFDETGITIHMDRKIKVPNLGKRNESIKYGITDVEPFFIEKTLEMVNYSPFTIEIPVGAKVAQLYLYSCTTNARPYNGRYQNSSKPTISISEHL